MDLLGEERHAMLNLPRFRRRLAAIGLIATVNCGALVEKWATCRGE
jgi:hypothetical protein